MADENVSVDFEEPVEQGRNLTDVTYNSEKDFYKGMSGELRYKAEGLFKKAKEKGISIEDIEIQTVKENEEAFPGIGTILLPFIIVKVKGKHLQSGQVIVDGKQIDYYNRYKKYLADKINDKNIVRDERGKKVYQNGKVKYKENFELQLDERELFEIAKNVVEDKEFGLEKTITGACDRVIRKLMGENDWLFPEEARLLDEEFNTVQEKIAATEQEKPAAVQTKKATERQISFLKSKIKNYGLDPDNSRTIKEIGRLLGVQMDNFSDLSVAEMSRMIDSISSILPKVNATELKQ